MEVMVYSIRIQVFIDNISSKPFCAHVVVANPALDVAMVAVDVSGYLKNIPPGFITGVSDSLRPLHKVKALGFALGSPHLQTTAGIVSGGGCTWW